jgi:hypothetical protein
LSVNNIPPFAKGGLGGFFASDPKQIPLCPPFSKGDLNAEAYSRINSKVYDLIKSNQNDGFVKSRHSGENRGPEIYK